MKSITTLAALESWLCTHGNGIGVSHTNCSFTVFCATGTIKGGGRTLLGAGSTISIAVENASKRIAELKIKYGTTPQELARQIEES